ncbi:MAG: sensor histidine kinase [Traorella sp.]
MEKKIYHHFFFVALISVFATLLVTMTIFYGRFRQQVSHDLKLFAHVISIEENWEEEKEIAKQENIRITLIDKDGVVLLDSEANASEMENHNDRPEVIEARLYKESSVTRNSNTFSNISTYYYALLLDNQYVLRVSCQVNSLSSIFFDALPIVLGITFLILMITLIISRLLTKSIMQPINEIANNVDHMQDVKIYKELIPFVNTIKLQHENIMKQSKLRQDFTANVTHELKTPLTSISGYSELIETGMASESDMRHFASEIHKSSQRLLTTINDIIRLSELDSEAVDIFEKIDLYSIAQEAMSSLRINADKYEVNLYLHGQSEMIYANKECMIELICNLVDNAIRYNKKNGRVDIWVDHNENNSYLRVKDNGIGIDKKDHERIFERFYRVDKSRSKASGGTGLGLAIVKHIVMIHQAELKIESEIGKGTDITIYFKKS